MNCDDEQVNVRRDCAAPEFPNPACFLQFLSGYTLDDRRVESAHLRSCRSRYSPSTFFCGSIEKFGHHGKLIEGED